jgi:hypothetical protein
LALVATLAVLVCARAASAQPANLVRDGDFASLRGWSVSGGSLVEQAGGETWLRLTGRGTGEQEMRAPAPGTIMSCAADLWVEEITGQGFFFAAVYQLSEYGDLVTYADFVTLRKPTLRRRYEHTFVVAPGVAFISLRFGFYQAEGVACTDRWTLVQGRRAQRYEEVVEVASHRTERGGRVAIFREPGFPVAGAASDPEKIATLLGEAGVATFFLAADELADPARLNTGEADLLVLPYGASFPEAAREAVVEFLHTGGHLVSLGGYAFNNLLTREGGEWRSWLAAREEERKSALSWESNLLPDGGFEQAGEAPIGGESGDGRWHRDDEECTVTGQGAVEGARCAEVRVSAEELRRGKVDERKWYLRVPVQPGHTYRLKGKIKTSEVSGAYAFVTIEVYSADGRLLATRDVCQLKGNHAWRDVNHPWTRGFEETCPDEGAVVMVKCGLRRARGRAWFDAIHLVDVTEHALPYRVMNTSTGVPAEPIGFRPDQIGIFDADYQLARVRRLQSAPEQRLFEGIDFEGDVEGWAAAGIVGHDNSRWAPLLLGYDRYGRVRGPAGAIMYNYAGYYAGSIWACFGVSTVDLLSVPGFSQGFVRLAKHMLRGVSLGFPQPQYHYYEPGESVNVQIPVRNFGARAFQGELEAGLVSPEGEQLVRRTCPISLGAGRDTNAQFEIPVETGRGGVFGLRFRLVSGGEQTDMASKGIVVADRRLRHAAAALTRDGNYLRYGDRSLFLFGSDSYASDYRPPSMGPGRWLESLSAARDYGLNLNENLQYDRRDHTLGETDRRAFDAMTQVTEQLNLVFMPGLHVGANVAISQEELEAQGRWSAQCASELGDVPALIWYPNGDFSLEYRDLPALEKLWNQWLLERYRSREGLAEAWGGDRVYGEPGSLAFPPPNSGAWDDPREIDRQAFNVYLMNRWIGHHVASIRRQDPAHPIISEYYHLPNNNNIDPRLAIDGHDLHGTEAFDSPEADVDTLPWTLRYNDLRYRGKGVSLGEYGAMTHPAFDLDNGAEYYHVRRSQEQLQQLFMAVAAYGLGLGAYKIQNWCLRDDDTQGFPWGIFYPNMPVPKDIAFWHRNLSLIWRFFAPKYEPPALSLLLGDCLRLGNNGQGPETFWLFEPVVNCEAAYRWRAIDALMGLHYDFNVVDDWHLDEVPEATRVMLYSAPLAVREEDYSRLVAWVENGGILILTGHVNYDLLRRPVGGRRLEKLAGVEVVDEPMQGVARDLTPERRVRMPDGATYTVRPAVVVRAENATVLLACEDGTPLVLRNRLGKGAVIYVTDAPELSADEEDRQLLGSLYGYALEAAKAPVEPLAVTPNQSDIYVMAQATEAGGKVHVVFPTAKHEGCLMLRVPTAAGSVSFRQRYRYPALAAVAQGGRLVSLLTGGYSDVDGVPVVEGDAMAGVLSLDGADIRESRALLLAPFAAGRISLIAQREWQDPVVCFGGFENGDWKTFEVVAPSPGHRIDLALDADRATALALVCERELVGSMERKLGLALAHPELLTAY